MSSEHINDIVLRFMDLFISWFVFIGEHYLLYNHVNVVVIVAYCSFLCSHLFLVWSVQAIQLIFSTFLSFYFVEYSSVV